MGASHRSVDGLSTTNILDSADVSCHGGSPSFRPASHQSRNQAQIPVAYHLQAVAENAAARSGGLQSGRRPGRLKKGRWLPNAIRPKRKLQIERSGREETEKRKSRRSSKIKRKRLREIMIRRVLIEYVLKDESRPPSKSALLSKSLILTRPALDDLSKGQRITRGSSGQRFTSRRPQTSKRKARVSWSHRLERAC